MQSQQSELAGVDDRAHISSFWHIHMGSALHRGVGGCLTVTCDRKNSKKKDDVIAFSVEILVMSSSLSILERAGA